MAPFLEKFETFVKQNHLINLKDFLLVAVSGGVDSVVLLHLLFQIKDKFKLKLQIIHLNHGIRGEQADRDQKFVEQLAEKYRLPIESQKMNVPKFSNKEGVSEEEGARILRYRFFEQVLEKTGANWVTLGHQANDQVETVIDHFIRGSGLKGLSGMMVKRDKYIRPLLFAKRKEIETYAEEFSLDYIIDSTNEMPEYRRNRIRHELIPQIKKHFNPGVSDVVLRTAEILQQAEEYLSSQAQKALDSCLINFKKNKIILDINSFLNYFTVIQKYILFRILELWNINRSLLTSEKIDRLLKLIRDKKSDKRFFLNSAIYVQIDHGQLVFIKEKPADFEFEIEKRREYFLPESNLIFLTEEINADQLPEQFFANSKVEYIDYDQIKGKLKIRNFRTGDRFFPLNLKGGKKVSDFFTDRKVPLHLRNEIPILVCESGIVWIIGYRLDDRFKIGKNSTKILKLQVKEKLNE